MIAVSHIAFLFPGQGSQAVGMAQHLAQQVSSTANTMAEADAILGFALSKLCFDGPEDVLTDTINAQPALLATSVATLRAIQEILPSSRPHRPSPATAWASIRPWLPPAR